MHGTNDADSRNQSVATSRRRFLSLTAIGTLASIGGPTNVEAQSQPETIRLGGEIAGWQGRVPDSIAGETNPTLRLEAGTTYRVVWENLDGMGHNFALLDDDGNVLERTQVMSEEGETQTLTFTAREAMAEYVCQPHITSMHGAVSFGQGPATTPTSTPTETADPDADPLIPPGPLVRLETIVDSGLTAPVDFEVPPGGSGRRFIVDRPGQVYLHTDDGLREEPYIDVDDRMAEISGEMGLQGMVFHPDFQRTRTFYLRYSAPLTDETPDEYSHTEVLAEFTANEGSTLGANFERRLLGIPSPQDTHNAGAISFGPDGYLYMSMGDGGGAHDVGRGHVDDWYKRNRGGNGQDVEENLLGSILRIDVNREEDGKPYAIPNDNPLVGKPGLDEQFAWGFRNPWRMGFSNGKLFAADSGQNMFEEVDIVRKGGNYGWNVREGTHCFKPGPEGSRNPPAECPERTPSDVRGGEPLISPTIEYPHTYEGGGIGSAVVGGYVYENGAISSLTGKYIFGDFRKTKKTETPTGSLFAATPTNEGLWELEELMIENSEDATIGAYLLAMGRDNDGGLYALSSENPGDGTTGAVHRIRSSNEPERSGDNVTAENQSATTTTTTTTGTSTASTPNTKSFTPDTTTTTITPATSPNGTTNTTERTRASTTVGDTSATTTIGVTATEDGSITAGDANTRTDKGSTSGGSSGSGPGFGSLAALAGLAIGAVRLLTRRNE